MGKLTILGAGMAGFGAAHRLHSQGIRSVLYEKHPYHGGHTASWTVEGGFTFDEGPHVSFTDDPRIQNLLAESVSQQYETVKYKVNNFWKGHWVKHPVHCNLYGLPTDLVVRLLRDFIHARQNGEAKIKSYQDWLFASYGEEFARTFPMEYTKKFHTTTADNMSTDWLGPRMYRPKLEEVLLGAITPATPDYHYVTSFRYPSRNGFVSYFKLFLDQTELKLAHEAVAIDPKTKEISFSNGARARYDGLVSSLPLTELIPLIQGVPPDVLSAARKLACTSCVLVNVGLNREDISDNTVTYFYDDDFFFTRLSFPHLMSRDNVPPGCGSIQAEVYYSSKYRPLKITPQDCIERVIADLRRCGLIREDDKILHKGVLVCPYAQVIFDLDRAAAVSIVHGYLNDIGIAYCGRYGDWEYTWTDQAFKSGEIAAQKVLDRLR
jgi:protoporphyrinogen oxidase